MIDKNSLKSKMMMLATSAHYGQTDKQGQPYIFHPIAVMNILNTLDEELQCIALGHDLIEDTVVTVENLRNLGMTDRIINGILALTKVEGESYEDYKLKVKSNPDAVKVKMADLTHNSDFRRLKGISEKDIERMVRYMRFYSELKALDV